MRVKVSLKLLHNTQIKCNSFTNTFEVFVSLCLDWTDCVQYAATFSNPSACLYHTNCSPIIIPGQPASISILHDLYRATWMSIRPNVAARQETKRNEYNFHRISLFFGNTPFSAIYNNNNQWLFIHSWAIR